MDISKGNYPRLSDIEHAFVVDGGISNFFASDAADAPYTLIVGLTKSKSKHCILLRCNNKVDIQSEKCSNLYKMLRRRCGKKGLEVNRKGGSSGLTHISDLFYRFLYGGYFPGSPNGLKLFQNETSWTGIYMKQNETTRTPIRWTYCQPQIGGQVTLKSEDFDSEAVLCEFVAFKMISADILYAVDSTISPSAVQNQKRLNDTASGTELDRIKFVARACKFTLVQHPVGYHCDVFSDNKPTLENRICFVDNDIIWSTGRGGAGKSKFVWALLDWNN